MCICVSSVEDGELTAIHCAICGEHIPLSANVMKHKTLMGELVEERRGFCKACDAVTTNRKVWK